MSRNLAVIVALLIVAALFVFPPRFFKRVGGELIDLAQGAMENVEEGNFASAKIKAEALENCFGEAEHYLKFLIDHEEVDKMDAEIRIVKRCIELEDKVWALRSLESLVVMLEYIPAIEKPSIENVLSR